LIEAYAREVRDQGDIVEDLSECITAVELHQASYEHAREPVKDMLVARNVAARKAEALATRWLKQGDFLLLSH
jgi:4'-phosphopantetheinyl transferase EntD